MKTNRLLMILALLLSLAAAACLLFRYNVCNIRGVEPSRLYSHWEHTDGVQATYIHNYKINDTVRVDVTLLQATDSAGWDILQQGFSIPIPEEPVEIKALDRGGDVISMIPNEKINFQLEQSDIVISSYRDRRVLLFHTHSLDDKAKLSRSIFLYKIKKLNQQL